MTMPCEDRDFYEWHRGIPHAYLWGFRTRTDIRPVREALDGLVLPRYERDPHVTVAYCGLEGTEFTLRQRDADLRRLRPLCRGPVQIAPWRWASFPPSPMLELRSSWVHEAHATLSEGLPHRMLRPYRPHITVGFYAVAVPFDEPAARMATVPLPEPFEVNALELLRYDTHDIAGPLTVVGRLDLSTGCYASA
ncbi:MAG: 2'-5' RNA ligase family protein [Propionibacteriaceae bacterium]|nr:2'-5' RNA ligase family protein [Propionibacteriaceae bacterium]